MSDQSGEEIKVRDRRTYGEGSGEKESDSVEADKAGGAGDSAAGSSAHGDGSREKYDEAVGECVEPEDDDRPLPPVDFSTLVLSIAQGALVNLGDVPHPDTGERTVNFSMARHNIDLLGMLQDKTRGNLDREERQLLENLLYDLRMKYVNQCKPG